MSWNFIFWEIFILSFLISGDFIGFLFFCPFLPNEYSTYIYTLFLSNKNLFSAILFMVSEVGVELHVCSPICMFESPNRVFAFVCLFRHVWLWSCT